MLPHLAHQKRYKGFYQKRSREGDYIILDNGAAEGVEFGPKHLHTIAEFLGANEIVVPDVLGDTEETLARALAFSRYARPEFRYMAVIQGQSVDEALKCLNAFTSMPTLAYVTTIGIPRILSTTVHKNFRLTLAEFITEQHLDAALEYHALGASAFIREVILLSEYEVIRGIDTSMPIYMGLEGLDIRTDAYIPRPEGYFDADKDHKQVGVNIDTYVDWAGGAGELPETAH